MTPESESRLLRHFGANQSGGTQHHAISIVQEPWHDKEPLHCTAGSGTLARARSSRPKADRADRDLRRQQDSGDLCRTRETKEEEEGAATLPQPGSRREHLRELFEENRRASWVVGPTCILGPTWGLLGASWGHLGVILGPPWGHLGAIVGHLGAILGTVWHVVCGGIS